MLQVTEQLVIHTIFTGVVFQKLELYTFNFVLDIYLNVDAPPNWLS